MNRFRACFAFSLCVIFVSVSAGRGEPPITADLKAQRKTGDAATDRYGGALPEGAVARLGTLRFWHGESIRSVAFSPDSKSVVSVSRGVNVWDVATGKKRGEFIGHQPILRSADFTPDGKMLLAAHWGTDAVYFWDVESGRLVRHVGELPLEIEIIAHTPANEVRNLALSSDGKILATTEQGLRLWDVATGESRGELTAERKRLPFGCVTFSPDGKCLAAGDAEGNVRVWDLTTKKAFAIRKTGEKRILCLAYSPDGKTLASGAEDGRVCLWESSTGKAILQIEGDQNPVRSLAFLADGKALLGASAERISLWDVLRGTEIRRYTGQGNGFKSVALSPDGRLLAAGGEDGFVRLWEVATGKPAVPFESHSGGLNALAFSPDGKNLACGSSQETLLWDVGNRKLSRRLGEEGTGSCSLAYCRDGRKLIRCDSQNVLICDPQTGKDLTRLDAGRDSAVRAIPCADGKTIISRHQSGVCRSWDSASGKMARDFAEGLWQLPAGGGILELSPDSSLVAVSGLEAQGAWDKPRNWIVGTKDGQRVRLLATGADWGRSAAFSPDGTLIAVATRDVCLFEIATGKEILRIVRHEREVRALAFAPDGRSFASGGDEGDICLWEVASGKERCCFRGHGGRFSPVRCLAFSPREELLASGGEDTTILLWDVLAAAEKAGAGLPNRSEKDLASLWADLSDDNATRSYAALCRLIKASATALPLLKDLLVPVPRIDAKRIDQLLADLDSEEFDVRERASRELAGFRETAVPALNALLKTKPSPETRRRAEELLARFPGAGLSSEGLREVRAVEILEHIGTTEACKILETLAKGAPEARLTREAKSSLDRVAR